MYNFQRILLYKVKISKMPFAELKLKSVKIKNTARWTSDQHVEKTRAFDNQVKYHVATYN